MVVGRKLGGSICNRKQGSRSKKQLVDRASCELGNRTVRIQVNFS
jgi:hypothetical protein